MTVFVGLINTHVIKAPEIPGKIAPMMTCSQEDRSFPAKKKYIWWEKIDVAKCIDPSKRHPETVISRALTIQNRLGKRILLIPWQWIHLLHKPMYWKICLRLQRAWSKTTNYSIHCIHFICPMRYFCCVIRPSLILNKSAPVHWCLRDLPRTTSCSAVLLMGVWGRKEGLLLPQRLQEDLDISFKSMCAPDWPKGWEIWCWT